MAQNILQNREVTKMLSQQTIDKLQLLRLKAMAKEYARQLDSPTLQKVSFDDRLGLMVDYELNERENKKLDRFLKQAKFRYSAQIESIEYKTSRQLNKVVINNLSSCAWITRQQNIILTGATGTGKSWLACAFGNEACRKGFSVIYKTALQLYEELQEALADGSLPKYRMRLNTFNVMILDDLGLTPVNDSVSHILLDIVDKRMQKGSFIITSQLPLDLWYGLFTDKTLAEAILDRIVHKAHHIEIKGGSLRKRLKQD